MDDRGIIALFFQRSEGALEKLIQQYGKMLYSVAQKILHSKEDAEECVNDAAWDVWNSIPPKQPESLSSYACALVRNRALDRHRYLTAQKRTGDRFAQILDELKESIGPGLEDVEDIAKKYNMKDNAVSVRLYRMRQRLRELLQERGVQV